MAEINQTLTQLKLEPANTKNLKSFVGELNGNLKILEKGKALLSDEDLIILDRLVMGKDASVSEAFANAVVDEVEKITKTK